MTHSKRSILGFNWQQKFFDERLAKTINQRFELPEILSNLLASREVSIDEIENFLEPKIKAYLPDPFLLSDMQKGVDYVIKAINAKKKITIFADYDVDGATSAAILKRFLGEIGVEADIYIPDRILEGYGPNKDALLKLKEAGTDLVITLDCGTVAFEPLEAARKVGLDVIVIDHHLGVVAKPDAIAVINPNNLGEKFEHKNLCAAGVTFLFVVAINKVLRESGFYANQSILENPPLEGGSKSQATSGRGQDFKKATRFYSKEILEKAQELRSNQTDAEGLLWYYLQNKQLNGHKFRRQQAIGNYIVDFVCMEKKLVIELDGGQHSVDKVVNYDKKRTEFLQKNGFEVLRFWNDEVFKNMDGVLESVLLLLDRDPSPNATRSTLPQGEGNLSFAPQADAGPQGDGNYSLKKIKEPNLLNLLDLVALGTVCDVMSLTGLNRAFVSAGLKILKQRKNLGLRTICDKAGLDEEPNAYHLGFVIGPRINAGGRVGTSNLGAEILSTQNESRAEELADLLEKFNSERKEIEAQVLEEAKLKLAKSEDGYGESDGVIFAVGKDWHPGVIGIVASRLKDLYEKPVAVIAIDSKSGKAKASCRSISGIDFGAEILNARAEEIITEGGGHAMAGGFSIAVDKIRDLYEFFNKRLAKKVEQVRQEKRKEFDIELDLAQVNIDLLKELSLMEPFGVGNQRPKFILRDVQKIKANLIGKTGEHISCIFSSKTAVGFNGQIQAVVFRSSNNAIGEFLLNAKSNKPINLVGTLNINSWMGSEKVQMVVEDILVHTK